jgi:DNA-binding response OmpR family regulator
MSTRPIKTVLLIQNDAEEARLIGDMFNDQGSYSFALTRVECMADAEAFLKAQSVSVVLLDLSGCPDATGDEAISRAHAAGRGASIVLLIGPRGRGDGVARHAWKCAGLSGQGTD